MLLQHVYQSLTQIIRHCDWLIGHWHSQKSVQASSLLQELIIKLNTFIQQHEHSLDFNKFVWVWVIQRWVIFPLLTPRESLQHECWTEWCAENWVLWLDVGNKIQIPIIDTIRHISLYLKNSFRDLIFWEVFINKNYVIFLFIITTPCNFS